jgi:spore coat protein CotH
MKHILQFVIVLLFIFSKNNITAQSNFYHPDTIQEIRITFAQTNWDHLLDSLYIDGEKDRILCSVEINGENFDSVGIRYKGFSSVSIDRRKNPFNIKLDYVKGNQDYEGFDKIKLSNVIQDPSFLREVMAYEVGRKYMPSSEANFTKVYINNVYWGLYTNVEAVNKKFVSNHFGSRDNSFFKCNPEDLDFDGENSNLGNYSGTDTTDYYPFYDLESDYGWTDLDELIEILNNNPADIETILNVDRTLWMHAFNYAIINFDSYVGYAQNYYIYQDDNGQFNPILWDLNQSFASYRLTDASEHFDGFSIAEAKTMDPLLHYSSVSIYPRPLMENLFEKETYRKMYLAHLRTIIEENFANQEYTLRGQFLQDLIENSVVADTNKFYTDDHFYNNLNTTVSDLVDYPGLIDLMDARTSYLQSYAGYQGAPTISNNTFTPQNISIGDNIWITAEIANAANVTLAYRFGGNGLFQKIAMIDDGTQNDGAANDGIYGIQLSNIGNAVQYYIYAENAISGQFAPQRAAYEYYLIQANIDLGNLAINEIMASNNNTITDNAGEYDDWMEFYNNTDSEISTAGLYLSDDVINLKKWAFPDISIAPNDYLVVWADEDSSQGNLHANFKLSSSNGETLTLVDESENIIDSITFGVQLEDVSFGRIPNGTGPFMEMPTTFRKENSLTISTHKIQHDEFEIFPNPVNDILYLKFKTAIPNQIQLYSIEGKLLQVHKMNSAKTITELNVANLSAGLYFISVLYDDFISNQKVVIQP